MNYNVKFFIEQCLCSVQNAVKKIHAEIIVVDNNSTDGSKDFFKNKCNNVQFIWNQTNLGFSKANNIGLEQAIGKYILFLNPDTIIPEDCLQKCLGFFESQRDAGALGIHMIDGAGKFLKESKRGFPSPFTSLFKLCGLAVLFPGSKVFARYYLGNLPANVNHVVDVLSGAFMMIEKKTLAITGAFDEDFFMYGEDIDLSYRIQKAGYKNYYFSESTIIHFKGESTSKGTFRYVRLFYGAMGLFVSKHYSGLAPAVYQVVIKLTMYFKLLVTIIKNVFLLKRNTKKKAEKYLPALVVAGEQDYRLITAALENARVKLTIIGRADFGERLAEGSIGTLQEMPELIKRYQLKEVIFCINGLPVKEVISIIQNIKAPVAYSFHAAGSGSIVGSNKNEAIGFSTSRG